MRIFVIDNDRSIAGDITIPEDKAFYDLFFNTTDLVIPKWYAGLIPLRILCTRIPTSKYPSVVTPEGKPLAYGPVLIFGCTDRGWQRSLMETEIEYMYTLCKLCPIKIDSQWRIAYSIYGISDKPSVELYPEEEDT